MTASEEAGCREAERPGRPSVAYSWPLIDAEIVDVTLSGTPVRKPARRDLDAVVEREN
jgi:hypothetical protein